ncbi:YraN family protein [Alloscardovia omnicolens]|uniref:YraN family protein n=1 Tax=Alloscardovia omnicolens TaxID=419015 RepID=UPI003A6E5B3E
MNTQTCLPSPVHTCNPAQDLGRFGEEYSCQYIRNLGWSILDRNWRCRFGEIDIVALSPATNHSGTPILVFLEVKTRRSDAFGDPLEAITPVKCLHMRKAAMAWLAQHHTKTPQVVRFDAIGMIVDGSQVRSLTHIRRIV